MSTKLPVDGNGNILSPLAGFRSELLKNDLRLPSEDNDGIRFLFGQCVAEKAECWPTRDWKETRRLRYPPRVTFYIVDDPTQVELIDSIMTVRKLRDDDDSMVTYGWDTRYGSKSTELKFQRRITLSYDNEYWELRVYPLGFRFLEPDDKGKFNWEESNLHYSSFARFLEARKDVVRNLCQEILQAREVSELNPDVLPETVPDSHMAPQSESVVLSAGELEKLPSEAFCKALNERLDVLRSCRDLSGIEKYASDVKFLSGEHFVQEKSGTKHTRLQALRYLARMERIAKTYQKYSGYFVELEDQVDEIDGLLSVENVHYAEIEVAADQPFTPNEKATRVLRFSYSPQGVVAARKWLAEEKECYQKCADQLKLANNDGAAASDN